MPRVTLKAIAERLGYSKNTISLALRNSPQIPEATRNKIKKLADEMGYQTNAVVSQLMAQLRSSQTPRFQAKLALINAHTDANAFKTHPTIPNYVTGCEDRAKSRGYSFDHFWLHDPQLTPEGFIRVMKTRNIQGLVIVGLMSTNRLPEALTKVWQEFPVAVTGVQTRQPTLSFCCVDHYDLARRAFHKAIDLGYDRPALILDKVIDRLVEHRFSAGYLSGQQTLPADRRIPPFLEWESQKENRDDFKTWFIKYKPDVVLILYNSVIAWLEELDLQIPEDVGVIQLEWRKDRPNIAGMDQHNTVTGEAVVDMVINQIHSNERGIPQYPLSTLIGSSWTDGQSVRSKLTEV
ncbi:MAG: LacI family DNA-binding transcriptional regulator [Verrucomicrobia bacterium]|nr:LacI family DNA-binding transcriptional regulator [Verrucomicrobiota bacterium]